MPQPKLDDLVQQRQIKILDQPLQDTMYLEMSEDEDEAGPGGNK